MFMRSYQALHRSDVSNLCILYLVFKAPAVDSKLHMQNSVGIHLQTQQHAQNLPVLTKHLALN